jgi:VWFA-related protein
MTRSPCAALRLWPLLAAVLVAYPAAQQAPLQVPGAIRSRVTLIPVEVYVTDRSGRPVKNLKAGDFTVREDGVRQDISQFSTHDFLQVRSQPAPSPGAPLGPATSDSVAVGRTYLILLGRGRLDEPSKGMAALEEFVRDGLGPADRVSVMAYSRVTDLVTDRQSVLRLLAEYRARYRLIETHLDEWFTGLTFAFAGTEIPPHIQREMDAIFATPGLPRHRELPTAGAPPRSEADGGSTHNSDLDELQRLLYLGREPDSALSVLNDTEGQRRWTEARQDWEALFTAVEYLRYFDGPKHLIYVTENPLFQDMGQLARIANDAGVSLWPIQTGGNPMVRWSRTHPPRFIGPSFSSLFSLLGLRGVAEQTGGRASIQEYSNKGFRVLQSTTAFQYLLGYYPTRTVDDGRYHHLKVELRRKDPDLVIRHRSGYFAREKLVPTDFREFQVHRRILSATQHWRDIRDIPVTWHEPGISLDRDRRQVSIQVSIDASALEFMDQRGVHKASLDFAVFALDRRGRPAGQTWQTVDIALNEERLAQAKKSGIEYRANVAVTDDAEEVRLAVYQFSVDRIGTITRKVR